VPGHDDVDPSVTVFTDRHGHQRWRCWSGDDSHRGDAIDLISVVRRVNRADAIAALAARVPGLVPARRPRGGMRRSIPIEPSPAIRDYVAKCADLLWTPAGAAVLEWLRQRGLTDDDVLQANVVGADPGCRKLPRPRGLPSGRGTAATFAVMHRTSSAIRYVQARYLDPGQRAKYDNPAASLATNPRLAWGRATTDPIPDWLVVCEGIPDALTALTGGFQAVALLGSQSASRRAADEIADHAAMRRLHLVAVVDADPAGRAAGARLRTLLAACGHPLRLVEPAVGLDLNSWQTRDRSWKQQLVGCLYDIDELGAQHPVVRRQRSATMDL
jgi:hypothetical protein